MRTTRWIAPGKRDHPRAKRGRSARIPDFRACPCRDRSGGRPRRRDHAPSRRKAAWEQMMQIMKSPPFTLDQRRQRTEVHDFTPVADRGRVYFTWKPSPLGICQGEAGGNRHNSVHNHRSERPADQEAKDNDSGQPKSDLPARVVPVALGGLRVPSRHAFRQAAHVGPHIRPEPIRRAFVFGLPGVHALLRDGDLPRQFLRVRVAAQVPKGRLGHCPVNAAAAGPGVQPHRRPRDRVAVADQPLAPRRRDHASGGHSKDPRDGHIRPDLVLITRKPDPGQLGPVRPGSHSEHRP